VFPPPWKIQCVPHVFFPPPWKIWYRQHLIFHHRGKPNVCNMCVFHRRGKFNIGFSQPCEQQNPYLAGVFHIMMGGVFSEQRLGAAVMCGQQSDASHRDGFYSHLFAVAEVKHGTEAKRHRDHITCFMQQNMLQT
jgi:hypothetical protein